MCKRNGDGNKIKKVKPYLSSLSSLLCYAFCFAFGDGPTLGVEHFGMNGKRRSREGLYQIFKGKMTTVTFRESGT